MVPVESLGFRAGLFPGHSGFPSQIAHTEKLLTKLDVSLWNPRMLQAYGSPDGAVGRRKSGCFLPCGKCSPGCPTFAACVHTVLSGKLWACSETLLLFRRQC